MPLIRYGAFADSALKMKETKKDPSWLLPCLGCISCVMRACLLGILVLIVMRRCTLESAPCIQGWSIWRLLRVPTGRISVYVTRALHCARPTMPVFCCAWHVHLCRLQYSRSSTDVATRMLNGTDRALSQEICRCLHGSVFEPAHSDMCSLPLNRLELEIFQSV